MNSQKSLSPGASHFATPNGTNFPSPSTTNVSHPSALHTVTIERKVFFDTRSTLLPLTGVSLLGDRLRQLLEICLAISGHQIGLHSGSNGQSRVERFMPNKSRAANDNRHGSE